MSSSLVADRFQFKLSRKFDNKMSLTPLEIHWKIAVNPIPVKGLGYLFIWHKARLQIHRYALNLKDNDSRKLPLKYDIICWGGVIFNKWVKQLSWICLIEAKINLASTTDLCDSPRFMRLSWKHFPPKNWWLVKLKLLQVYYITYIFIQSE